MIFQVSHKDQTPNNLRKRKNLVSVTPESRDHKRKSSLNKTVTSVESLDSLCDISCFTPSKDGKLSSAKNIGIYIYIFQCNEMN